MSSIVGLDGWRHTHLDYIDSTNAEAMRLATEGDAGQLWITASEQTAGKARRGRGWVSKPGNLYASLLLFDVASPEVISNLPLVTAVALHRAILDGAPVREDQLRIKWPNDLLLDGKKLSGILLESTLDPAGRQAIVIGCGVNCSHFPDNPLYPATSLQAEGIVLQPEILFLKLAQHMAEMLAAWDRGNGFATIRRDWLARAKGVGEPLTARFEDGEITGIFRDMDEDGRLVLVADDGTEHRISAADIFFGNIRGLGA